jgi:hypothetical protein
MGDLYQIWTDLAPALMTHAVVIVLRLAMFEVSGFQVLHNGIGLASRLG